MLLDEIYTSLDIPYLGLHTPEEHSWYDAYQVVPGSLSSTGLLEATMGVNDASYAAGHGMHVKIIFRQQFPRY